MARKRKSDKSEDLLSSVQDYRHDEAKRVNNPPAKIAAEGTVPLVPKARYFHSPRRPPGLRFDPTGAPDRLPELLQAARERALTDEEAKALADALRVHEPWLEWAEKREQHQRGFFEVDSVALHIHERVSAQAILHVAAGLLSGGAGGTGRDLAAWPLQSPIRADVLPAASLDGPAPGTDGLKQ